MDDMFGTMTGDALLGRRLEAYAELRLSPDLATSARLRARVLAVAHRRAALSRADAGLTILSRPEPSAVVAPFSAQARAQAKARRGARSRGQRLRRAGAVVLAASFALSVAVGGVAAARPGGPLYETRLWAETLQLPTDPSARAVAELDRLKARLLEIGEASRSGDSAGAMAALQAYQSIVDEASASAILAGDDVAAAALQTGVGHNVEVLQALLGKVPSHAGSAISNALDAAIARSTDAVERIGASRPASAPGHVDGPAQNGGGPVPKATNTPTATPTAAPTNDPTARPKPTPKVTPAPTPKATPTHAVETRAPASPKPGHGKGLQGG
jgi:hypothetical protein